MLKFILHFMKVSLSPKYMVIHGSFVSLFWEMQTILSPNKLCSLPLPTPTPLLAFIYIRAWFKKN